jgi:2-keto-4-pentenoate hydratase/2-oxohepta-3-ene-1,7-dioic acid hydratase in catechol pathway
MPDEPLLFLKPPSSLIGPGQEIRIPVQSNQVEYEGEIGVVIGRVAAGLGEDDDPFEYVFGFTAVNDVTARDLQRKDVQFTRGKSFDTFCPVGPVIARGLMPDDLTVQTRVNGVLKQQGSSNEMAFSISFLIRYISNIMTLVPGDLIATGTPAGVSKLSPGDEVDVTVGGVGNLRNRVI